MNLPAFPTSKISEKYESTEVFGLIFPIFGIIASFLIAALVIWPKVNEIRDLQVSNKQLEKRVANLESKIETLAKLDKGKLEKQLISAEQLLPSEKNTFPFLSQVEGAAVVSGVVLGKIDVNVAAGGKSSRAKATSKSAQGLSESVSLSVSSDYQSLLQFLTNLDLFSRVTTVDAITIDSSVADGTRLQSSFTVQGYWKELPSTLGSVEAPIQPLTAVEEELLKEVARPESSRSPQLPQVPVGRGNLFTPF